MAREGGFVNRIREAAEERLGYTVTPNERLEVLEADSVDRRMLQRELHDLAYTALDYSGGRPQEVKASKRREMAQKARVVWMSDPQAGASVELLNAFVFGRGVPQPRASDPLVQEVLDEAWNDPDNKIVLTGFDAQLALGTDLQLQSNLFLLFFDDGDDGRVKVGLLDHDTVEDAVRDEDNRMRVLYYVAHEKRYKWDYKTDRPDENIAENTRNKREVKYYPHWRNIPSALESARLNGETPPVGPPADKVGVGYVYHVAVNRTSEQVFGVPTMQRLIRWFNAYNDFMSARVDQARAAAAFVMKRKVKGTKGQLERAATQALSKSSLLGSASVTDDGTTLRGPQPGSVLNENELVTHENFNLNTNAGNALTDGQMIRSQISAATHFPQHYLGDAGSANLATATSMELPVLKHVEARQEAFEQLFRAFLDRVIQRAQEAGRLPDMLSDAEMAAEDKANGKEGPFAPQDGGTFGPESPTTQQVFGSLFEAKTPDSENPRKRDVTYEFAMPSPLRRMMGELVTSVTGIAKTFDPNGTNMELNRLLLGVVLGQGLELDDAAKAVQSVFPPGYEDPAMAAFQAKQAADGAAPDGAPPAEAPAPSAEANPYGAPMQAQAPEDAGVVEGRYRDLPAGIRNEGDKHASESAESFRTDVRAAAQEALDELTKAL
jgi:hypothetical protein